MPLRDRSSPGTDVTLVRDNDACLALAPGARVLRSLAAPELDILFWAPARVGVSSAWWAHVPFMHWLVSSVCPRVAVELGTHHGVSFAALCEAARHAGTPGRCYAVDTWKGDSHSGFYDESVFLDLAAFVAARYGTFAELIRSAFGEAVTHFADGSIDLLHIDGLHTFEAVKADFETWLPKLSDRAVVLLHDTNVRRDDFGVWKLWADIKASYPSFEFFHGHGLGILAVGPHVPGAVRELCALDEAGAAAVRERFEALGARWAVAERARGAAEDVRDLGHSGEELAAKLERALAAGDAERARTATLAATVQRHKTALALERSRVANLTEQARLLRGERDAATDRLGELGARLEARAAEVERERAGAAALAAEARRRESDLARERSRVAALADAEQRVRAERDGATERISELAGLLDARTAEIERARGRLAEVSAAHRAQAVKLEAERRRSANAATRLTAEITALEQRRAEQAERAEALQRRVEDLETEREAAHALAAIQFERIAELESAVADQAEQLRLAAAPPPQQVEPGFLGWVRRAWRRGDAGHPSTRGEGTQLPAETVALSDADVIAASGLFDEAFYQGRAQAQGLGMSPIEHYLAHGEAAGLAPSRRFDPTFYRARYSDLERLESNLLLHFIRAGYAERRTARAAAADLQLPTAGLRADRETIVIAVHEASRTGAPIIGWNLVRELETRYNVVALLKRGGPLAQAFVHAASATVVLPEDVWWHGAESRAVAAALAQAYAPKYVIANSAEVGAFVPAFENAGVPTVALVHEFASYVKPAWAFRELLDCASEVVFPAQVVADAALADVPPAGRRDYAILRQGQCNRPSDGSSAVSPQGEHASQQAAQDRLDLVPADSILVIGVGTAIARKGVEFFIATAAAVARRRTRAPVVFAWAGRNSGFDEHYEDNLKEQIERSGLDDSVLFLGEFEDLTPLYERAHVFLLSSRLDPLPNVAIEAAFHGLPVVCFDRASGIAELLAERAETRDLVVPYLDAEGAADRIVELAGDPARYEARASAMRDVALRHFDMARYIEDVDALGRAAARRRAHAERDREVIQARRAFNAALYLRRPAASAFEGLDDYLDRSRRRVPRRRPVLDATLERPLEGFHPLIYAAEAPGFDEATGEDPLAHYARMGFPDGRWRHRVIRPSPSLAPPRGDARVVVHGHFHYTDHLADLVRRIRRNGTAVDLLVTTHAESVDAVTSALAELSVERARVEVVPNRGRNIGPFLTGPAREALRGYDLVMHVHGKRTSWAKPGFGERWRCFLWDSLIGDDTAVLDTVVSAFEADERLGVVFPEDPFLIGWDRNRGFADELAARMGWADPLPTHFEFPVGTMFCARPQALQSLFDLDLAWDDYPPEPLARDGTFLHAIERLIPFSAAHAGYGFATTYVQTTFR